MTPRRVRILTAALALRNLARLGAGLDAQDERRSRIGESGRT